MDRQTDYIISKFFFVSFLCVFSIVSGSIHLLSAGYNLDILTGEPNLAQHFCNHTKMVAATVDSIRKMLGISHAHDNEKWDDIREKADEIFMACKGHLRCGEKLVGWTSLDEEVRTRACAEVTFFKW